MKSENSYSSHKMQPYAIRIKRHFQFIHKMM